MTSLPEYDSYSGSSSSISLSFGAGIGGGGGGIVREEEVVVTRILLPPDRGMEEVVDGRRCPGISTT